MDIKIRKLDELLAGHLTPNEVIKHADYTSLTKVGDNFGSIMLKLDLTILNRETKEERILNLVAKILPQDERTREIFNIQTTYTNELGFYDVVVPTLENFQKEVGVDTIVDFFPKCYGTRKNLLENNSDLIDEDAVLLMENLKVQGYTNVSKTVGFHYQAAKLLLRDLARFHGSFLSMKLLKPELFKNKILPYCKDHNPGKNLEFKAYFEYVFQEVCKENQDCLPFISKYEMWGNRERNYKPNEKFGTLIHYDLWVNNMMQLFENDTAVKNKLCDFQVITYGSLACDVYFFLWTSVQKEVLQNHLDSLLQFYYSELTQTLNNHKCKVDLTYEDFLEELEHEADIEFSHALAFIMFLNMDFTQKIDDFKENFKTISLSLKEKLWFMLTECNKRRWLPRNN